MNILGLTLPKETGRKGKERKEEKKWFLIFVPKNRWKKIFPGHCIGVDSAASQQTRFD
jgi:hypothetical protein